MTDEQAMMAVVSGDLDKAAVLYERYKRPVLGYFHRSSVNRDTGEDLMQQVFYRIIHYRKSFSDGYVFKPWLFRIARNVLQDFIQKNRNVFSGLDERMEMEEEKTYDQEQEYQLKRALEMLPQEYREVILLSRYEELKYDEIAEILQISVSLVKVRVHRGLKILREIYFQME
ncbi:MAG: RNA polymerase sigma factor [Leadbetterella sp.]|nr:RNA polymerase sigma factor [Leadbetterella sp.]